MKTHIHHIVKKMKTTKVFMSGNSTAVRIPNEYGLQGHEVKVFRLKNGDIIIREVPKTLAALWEKISTYPKDLFAKREDTLNFEDRESF